MINFIIFDLSIKISFGVIMKFVNVKQFADMKNCSRENVYNAARNGEVDIDRSAGFPVIYLTNKNLNWIPKEKGRPKKESLPVSDLRN